MRIKLIVGLSLLLLTGCYTNTQLTIQVLEPGKVRLPPHIKKVLLVNSSYYGWGKQFNAKKLNAYQEELLAISNYASEDCMEGFFDMVSKSPRLELIPIQNTEIDEKKYPKFLAKMSWESIDSLCKNTGADAVMALSVFNGAIDQTNGKLEQIDKGYSSYFTEVGSEWKLYDPKSRRVVQSHQNKNSNVNLTVFDIRQAGYSLGKAAGQFFVPYWSSTSRLYYGINSAMLQASKLAEQENWVGAAEIWRKYVNDKDLKVAAQARFNMAFACEMEGKLDLAKYWANKSLEMQPREITQKYIEVLTRREKIQKEIDIQMHQE